jgi:hypothetical protein
MRMRGIALLSSLACLVTSACQAEEPEITCALGSCFDANGNSAQPRELGLTELDRLLWACELTEVTQKTSSSADMFFLRLQDENTGDEFKYCYGRGSSDTLTCMRRTRENGAEQFKTEMRDLGQLYLLLSISRDSSATYEERISLSGLPDKTIRKYTGNCVKGGAY